MQRRFTGTLELLKHSLANVCWQRQQLFVHQKMMRGHDKEGFYAGISRVGVLCGWSRIASQEGKVHARRTYSVLSGFGDRG
jgi:hypothetical protein